MKWIVVLAFACLSLSACEATSEQTAMHLTREELLDPQTCQGCHPQHYREWASSMHAYAADDPVFAAMNQRGQRKTDGALGPLCVKCHAPMAVFENATSDGLNLTDVPPKLKGVTCYVCHNAIGIGDHFNNGLQLANDATMRAAIDKPISSPAHAVAYDRLQDGNRRESSELCGSCHDVVVPSGVHLERTFEEYKSSLFGQLEQGFETCAGCHMPGRLGRASVLSGAPERTIHEHLWPAVDVALTPFPDAALQRQAVECDLALGSRIRALDYDGLGTFTVQTETSAGHKQPSGAAQDRRMWLEVIAYDSQENVVFESGRVADGEVVERMPEDPGYDPQLSIYRDWIYDDQGMLTHDFWEAAPSPEQPDGYESVTLPFTTDPSLPHVLTARFAIARYSEIARLTVRMRLQPIGIDVLQDLVASGDLDPSISAQMPTLNMYGAAVEWRAADASLHSLLPKDLNCPND